MQLSEAVKQLQAYGLSRYESVTFLNLARMGVATAREVARASGVNRVQTYRALESLEGRGLVEVALDRPKRYAARALSEAFDLIVDERRAELAAMEKIRESLLAAWPAIAGKDRATVRLQILKGRSQVYGALRRVVANAEKEVLAFTTTKGNLRSYRAGINDAPLRAIRRGARGRLIADLNPANASLFEKVARRVPLRHVEDQRGRFIIIDGESLFAFLIQDEGGLQGEAETALWTNSPDFVRSHRDFFERSWKGGVSAEARFRALRKAGKGSGEPKRRSTAGPSPSR